MYFGFTDFHCVTLPVGGAREGVYGWWHGVEGDWNGFGGVVAVVTLRMDDMNGIVESDALHLTDMAKLVEFEMDFENGKKLSSFEFQGFTR